MGVHTPGLFSMLGDPRENAGEKRRHSPPLHFLLIGSTTVQNSLNPPFSDDTAAAAAVMTGTMNGDAAVSAAATPDPIPQPLTSLRRRSSIAATVLVPAKLSVSVSVPSTSPNCSAAPRNQKHEHVRPPPSHLDYTSLRDLLPQFSSGAINSPTAAASPASGRPGCEISIRNRLVKQAAWAYLQPMSASPGSSGPGFSLRACLNLIAQALYRILRSLLRCCSVR